MSLVVIDASVALAWTIQSQATSAARSLMNRAAFIDFVAPAIFSIETRAALLKAERRGLIAQIDVGVALTDLGGLPVAIAASVSPVELEAATDLARAAKISLYDALYLNLALVERAILASRDGGLLAAATARGVATEDCR